VDKQFAAAVVLIIFGFALTQIGQSDGDNAFLAGLGIGTIAIASFWIVLRIISDVKAGRSAGGSGKKRR